MMKNLWKELVKGITLENPLMVLMIGLCSSLAVSTRAENAIFMGLAATFVLVCSNFIISILRKVTPNEIRIPIFIVVIASFVTIVDLTLRAYFPAVYARLGVWIPLIVVNCMILGRAEAFASKRGILESIADGLGMGLGYIWILFTMGFVRELFGTGQIVFFDKTVISFGSSFEPPRILILFPGAFLTFGFLMALVNFINRRINR